MGKTLSMPDEFDLNKLNVGMVERNFSVAAGGLIIALGISRRGWVGTTFGFVGGALLFRGLKGFCPLYDALGIDRVAEQAPDLPEAFRTGSDDTANIESSEEMDPNNRRMSSLVSGKPHRRTEDVQGIIGEASEESFPASDAPSWTNVAGLQPKSPEQQCSE